jgi:hypothetical protein
MPIARLFGKRILSLFDRLFPSHPNSHFDAMFYYRTGRAFDFVPASFAVKADSGDRCTSLVKTVFDVHIHDMSREGILEELWEEHLEATATIFCQDGGSSDRNAEERRRRRHDRFLYELDNDSGRALPGDDDSDADADDGHYSSRNLASVQRNTASASAEDGDGAKEDSDTTTQLTLKNLGGVFLLHGIMAGLSLLWATISWSRHRYVKKAAARKKESDGAGDDTNNSEHFMMKDVVTSSIDHDEFFDASTTAEDEFRQQLLATKSLENGSGIMKGNYNRFSNAPVDDLRNEMHHLRSIDQKLSALLDKKDK